MGEGKKVLPSPGLVSLCGEDAIIPANTSGPAYQGVYPQSNSVSLGDPYTWRDVYGAVLQILPVTVDHPAGKFLRDDKLGRVLVVHESQFKSQAQTYADL